MTKHFILYLLALFVSTPFFGQKFGDYYVSVSIDSVQGGRLKLISDSTVEISSIPQHMSRSYREVYKYKTLDTTIQIIPESINDDDNQTFLNLKSLAPIEKINLTKIEGGFIDYNRALIYVRKKDFGDNPDITYIIDGKIFIQDMGVTNGYGIFRKNPKKNKALQKKLKGINKENFTLEIVKGLNAYNRFGIKRVYGVIVITSK